MSPTAQLPNSMVRLPLRQALKVTPTPSIHGPRKSAKVTNTFTPGHVDCVVSGSGNRFTIAPDKDTNTNVYLRAAVVGNWVDGKGNVYWMAPSFEVSGSSWNKVGDYYYYQSEVAPGGEASELTVTLTSETPEGYTFQVQVLAEAIQSAPAGQTAWDNGGMN